MSGTYQFKNWRVSLGSRNNLFYSDVPYIPMLVEDIPVYLSLDDYEQNGVKMIQTLGVLIPRTETFAMIASLTPGNTTKFPINLRNLSVKDVYIKASCDVRCAVWKKYIVVRVCGFLNVEKGLGNVLMVSHLVPVYDLTGSWKVMTLLIEIARSEYRQYYRTKGQNNMLQLQWERMKNKEKRIIYEEGMEDTIEIYETEEGTITVKVEDVIQDMLM